MPFDNPVVIKEHPVITRLREGKARIHRGWCQNAISKRRANSKVLFDFCMVGGVRLSDENYHISNMPVSNEACNWLTIAVYKLMRTELISVPAFNDMWDRTKHDCEQAYEVAIELRERYDRGLPI